MLFYAQSAIIPNLKQID